MITLNKRRYERIVYDLIDGSDIRVIAERFAIDRVFYFHVLRDVSSGVRSPNYRILKRIAGQRKVSEDFIFEQARSVIAFSMPGHQTEAPDYYKTLDVRQDATEEEIRRKWIDLMKSHHPDMAGQGALDAAKRINEAYGVLGNAGKREVYDRRFMPPVPVIVPNTEIPRNFYIAVPFALVILIALVYASGSGLIFKSQEEKERLAQVIERPSLPNPVYRGDSVGSRTEKLEESVVLGGGDDGVREAMAEPGPDAPVTAPAEGLKTADSEKSEPGEAPGPDASLKTAETAPDETASEAAAEPGSPEEPDNTAPKAGNEIGGETVAAAKSDVQRITGHSDPAPQDAPAREPRKPEMAADKTEEKPADKEMAEKIITDEAPAVALKVETPPAPEVKSEPEARSEEKAPVHEIAAVKEPAPPGAVYTVKSGDSLWTVARRFDTTTAELKRLNGLTDNQLGIGDRLVVSGEPAASARARTVEAKTDEKPKGPEKTGTGPAITTVAEAKKALHPAPDKPESVNTLQPADRASGVFDSGLATTAVAREADIVRAEPVPAPEPDRDTLYNFVSEYKSAYKGRDLPRLKSLFSADAVENGVALATVINKYDSNFSALDIIAYDVNVHRALIQNSYGFVRGDFFITYKDTRTGALKSSRGGINWKLAWQGDEWKIVELNYKIESTGGIDG